MDDALVRLKLQDAIMQRTRAQPGVAGAEAIQDGESLADDQRERLDVICAQMGNVIRAVAAAMAPSFETMLQSVNTFAESMGRVLALVSSAVKAFADVRTMQHYRAMVRYTQMTARQRKDAYRRATKAQRHRPPYLTVTASIP